MTDYDGLKATELKDLLKERGIASTGMTRKQQYIEALEAQDAQEAGGEVTNGGEKEVNDNAEEPVGDNADATAANVREAGGTVVVDPFDVFDAGRMTIAQDPTGAVFGVWQAGEHIGAQLANEPGTLNWNECRTTDPDDARAVRVMLTDHGEQLLGRLSALHRDELRRMDTVLALPRWHASNGQEADR